MPRRNDAAQERGREQPRGNTAQDNNRNQPGRNTAQERGRDQPGANTAQDNNRNQPGRNTAQERQNDRATGVGNVPDRTRINITNDRQRTVIRNNIVRTNVQLPANVRIAIGTRLPSTIRFHPVPAAIVAVIPELEPYYYIVVDGQIVFVDPGTYEIVYVMPV